MFRLTAPLPGEAFAHNAISDYSEIDAAFDWAASLVNAQRRADVQGARVMLHALHGDLDPAVEKLFEAGCLGPTGDLATIAFPEVARRVLDRDGRVAGPVDGRPSSK